MSKMSSTFGNVSKIDKFLKKFKTDRNTFVTYILLMFSIYIVIDRLVEILLIAGTGMSVSYWGPIKYTLALTCVTFTLHFGFASKFVEQDTSKHSFLYVYIIGLYIVGISMFVQWINQLEWVFLFTVPRYSYILDNFGDLVKPAFSVIAWYLPLVTFYPLFNTVYSTINDTKDILDSIADYGGIDLSDRTKDIGPYTCELLVCKNSEDGKLIRIPENRRFESTLIVGVSGAGKTTLLFEPLIARDLAKKSFLNETAKELGYAALKTGLASLKVPYSNDYLNENFSLDMLSINPAKEKIYKALMNKLILNSDGDSLTYREFGLTYMAPDAESFDKMKEVADCFNLKYDVIDPNDPESIGFNPFAIKDPEKLAISLSNLILALSLNEMRFEENLKITTDMNATIANQQTLQNLIILLKVAYPLAHNGDLPTLEDLLDLLNDFEKIEELCKVMLDDEELTKEYKITLSFIRNNFFKNAEIRKITLQGVYSLTAQLEQLLRHNGIKSILCNRINNIDCDELINKNKVLFVCTRRGDLGAKLHKTFGLFFLLTFKDAALARTGKERSRTPHFLYIDEVSPFLCTETYEMFTLFRKYRIGLTISAQNLSQLSTGRETILANSTNKMVFGNNTPADNEWWSLEFGDKREWTPSWSYGHANTHNDQFMGDAESFDNKGIEYKWKKNYSPGKVQSVKAKQILYKVKDVKGKTIVGKSKLDFLESSYTEPHKRKDFNFSKYTTGVQSNPSRDVKTKASNFDDDGPIRINKKRSFFSKPVHDDSKNLIQNAITNYKKSNSSSDNNNNNGEDKK